MTKADLLWFAKWGGAFLVAQYAQIPQAVWTLIIFMAVDYASGLIMGFTSGQLSSDIGRKGLGRKLGTLILIFTLHLIESRLGIELGAEKAVAFGYAVNEAISIIENLSRCNVPIPSALLGTLSKFKQLQGLDQIKALVSKDGQQPQA